jgi:hypothetical protein
VPRKFTAIGVAALATAASGIGAILMAAAPAAAHAGCAGDFESRTQFNKSQNAPSVTYQPPNVIIYEGNVLLFATNESQYTFLLLDCASAAAGVSPAAAQ